MKGGTNKMRKQVQLILLSGVIFSLTGCSTVSNVVGNITGGQVELAALGLPNQDFSSKQEIMDYYAEAMKYANTSVRKAVGDDEIGYNNIEPNSETWNKLISNYQKTIIEHNKISDYEMTDGLHDYFKVFADQMVLSNSTVKRAKESGGYYYLTIEFSVNPNQIGTFNNRANYLGLDGVIVRDYYNMDTIDSIYLRTLLNKANDYRLALKQPLFPNYEDGQTDLEVPEVPETEPETVDNSIDTPEIGDDTGTVDGTEDTNTDTNTDIPSETIPQETQPVQQEDTSNQSSESDTMQLDGELLANVRRLTYDTAQIAKLAGSSQEQISYMPDINMVYNVANTEGELNGFGLYQEGLAGLTSFGYDTTQDSSKLIATFVFQQNELNPDEMNYSFMFINSFENSNPTLQSSTFTEKTITVPEFLNTQLGMLIENIDRAINNKDVASLMGNEILDDDGLGLRYAAYGKSSDIVTFSTNIKRIAERTDRTYLLELERTVEDSPKNAGAVAQYRDVYYAVVRQDGTYFKLNDIILVKRELTKSPVIEAESATIRRLVALNLSGEVNDNTKLDIQNGVIKSLSDNLSNKNLGFYDCFETDTTLLSQERREYLQSKLVGVANAKGYDIRINWKIVPTEWIGGYDTQVEFTTKEFIDYEGENAGTYMENYYLVSHYGTEWLIDDIVTMKEELVEGDRYNQLASEFKN